MKKILLLTLFIAFGARAYGFYFDAEIKDTPAYIIANDWEDNTYYTFFNMASFKLNLNVNDDLGLTFRLKDTFIALTNELITDTNRNSLYIDRLSAFYEADAFEIKAGRSLFLEGNGMLIGNVADGLFVRTSFLNFNQKLYLMYSGLLPVDMNEFNANSMDKVNGTERALGGLVLEKYGLFFKTISLGVLYSMDFSTNDVTNSLKDPLYISLDGDLLLNELMTVGFNFIYCGGTTDDENTVSAFALNLKYMMLFEELNNLGILAQVSYASGDDDGANFTQFKTFGYYDTGLVLVPEFSNLLMAKLGIAMRLINDNMLLSANYYYMRRLEAGDTVDGFYTGTGLEIGHEISGGIQYQFDPNFSVFVNGGYFMRGDSFTNQVNEPKLLAGVTVTL